MKIYTLILTLFISLPAAAGTGEPLNRIVAVVNDDVITENQLNDREALIRKQLAEQNTQLPARAVLRRQVLERLIVDKLQLQMAERSGIRVDNETLNASLQRMAAQNGMTLSDFREVLEQDGYGYETFREQLRDEIAMKRIRQQMVENRVQVTQQEIDNLLTNAASNKDHDREYRLSHILVSVPEAATPQQLQAARKRAEEILARLRAGADFAETAVAESDGQQALNGGDLGWRRGGKLPSFFSGVVSHLDKGQISELIRSPSGFHIVKITDIRGDERHIVQQTQARHILLRPDALHSESDVKRRLEQLRQRIENGEDFAKLARSHSQDTGSASRGGELGWVNPGDMVPEFEQAMDRLKPGEVSAPVQSRFGWHLIQVEARRQHDNTEEYRRASARESIRRRKSDEELEIWLRRLRDESYVEYRLDAS